MSNLGRLRNKARRSSTRNLRNSLNELGEKRTYKPKKLTKQQQETIDLGFTGYTLKYSDIMIVGDIDDIIPNWKEENGTVRNSVFTNIQCDKIGIVYSSKLKQFLYLALNDDYTISILWKFDKLPSNDDNTLFAPIDLDILNPNLQLIKNANRMLVSIYFNSEVLNLCQNPIIHYNIMEVFKK